MNIIDILIILFILMFGIIGYKRGVLLELVKVIGFILVITISFYLKSPIAEFLSMNLPFITFKGSLANATSFNIIFYQVITFIFLAIILEIILNHIVRITGLIEKLLDLTIIFGFASKILGILVGLIEGFVVCFLILLFLNQPAFDIDLMENSKLSEKILKQTPIISSVSGGLISTFNDIYDLVDQYNDDKIGDKELDLKSIDIMLDHKIISKDYVLKLVKKKNINIVGLDQVLNKY